MLYRALLRFFAKGEGTIHSNFDKYSMVIQSWAHPRCKNLLNSPVT